jgi:imidazolonepropionase-like amidohydrolase
MIKSFLVSMFCLLSFGLFAQEKAKHITLFTNVQVFDGTSDKLIKADVLVEGNLIKQISEEPLMVVQTDNVTIIDGGGNTLMPGMVEGHGNVMFASDLPKLLNQDEFEQGVHAARRANDYRRGS